MAERIAGAYIELVPKLAPGFNEAVKAQAREAGKGFADKFESAGKSISNVGKKWSLLVSAPLLGLGALAFKAAEDAQKVDERTTRIFAGQTSAVDKFAAGAATKLGLSRDAALTTADTFGNLFRSVGIGLPLATQMSLKFSSLAGDLASFANVPIDKAMTALRSGLAGNVRGLRQFGISLTQADITAEALRLHIAKAPVDLQKVAAAQLRVTVATDAASKAAAKHGKNSIEAAKANATLASAESSLSKAVGGGKVALDSAQKAQAAYALILQRSRLAQGDFARTADTAANRQRVLSAQFHNAAETIGKQLLPIGTRLIGFASGLLAKFASLSPATQHWIVDIAGVAAVLGPTILFVGKFLTAFGKIAETMKVLNDSKIATKVGQQLSGAFTFLAANPIVLIIAGIVALGIALFELYKHSTGFRNFVNAIGRGLEAVGRFFVRLPHQIVAAVEAFPHLLVSAGSALLRGFVNGIQRGAAAVWSFLRRFGPRILLIMAFAPLLLVAAGIGLLIGLGIGLVKQAPKIWRFFSSLPGRILRTIVGIDKWLVTSGVQLLGGLLKGIVTGAVAVFQWWARLELTILGYVVSAGVWLIETGVHILGGLLKGIINKAPDIAYWFVTLPSKIPGWIGDVATALFDVGVHLIEGLIKGIVSIGKKVGDAVGGVVKGAIHVGKSILGINSPSKVFHDIGLGTMEGLVNGIRAGAPEAHRAMARTMSSLNVAGGKLAIAGNAHINLDQVAGSKFDALLKILDPNTALPVVQQFYGNDPQTQAHYAARELALARRRRS